ncbi:MAG TPA: prenyltransferase [Planctomycetaceae bacterium]|nr:prenyltransferase [Planctomycetaceae bacterium]
MSDGTQDQRESGRSATRREWLRHLAAAAGGTFGVPVSSAFAWPLAPFRRTTTTGSDEAIDGRTNDAIERGLAWLVARQNDDGSFGDGDYARNTGVCAIAGIAFAAEGSFPDRGRFGRPLRRTVEFLLSQADATGLISNPQFRSRGPMYEHGFATLLMAELLGNCRVPGLPETLQRAVRTILDSQNDEGGWRYQPVRDDADVSVTVAQVMALRAARNAGLFVPDETVTRAVDYLKRAQNPDGGYRYLSSEGESAFPRSAAAIVALYNAGISSGPEIDRGLTYLQGFPPRAEPGPLPSHFFYGHYYAAQAMWHAGGEAWRNWYPAIRDLLLDRQTESGRWDDLLSPIYATAMATIILQIPNDLLPILQR